MKKDTVITLRAFLIELVVYGMLVVAYFFFVLHFLGAWLHGLETALEVSVVAVLMSIVGGLVLAVTRMSRTPILLVTANASPEHRAAGIAAGADGFVTKPLSALALHSAMAELEIAA